MGVRKHPPYGSIEQFPSEQRHATAMFNQWRLQPDFGIQSSDQKVETGPLFCRKVGRLCGVAKRIVHIYHIYIYHIYSYISKQAIFYPITKILVASEKFLVETCGNLQKLLPLCLPRAGGASPWCSTHRPRFWAGKIIEKWDQRREKSSKPSAFLSSLCSTGLS